MLCCIFFYYIGLAVGLKGDGGNAVDIGSKVEPQMCKCETNTKAIRGARAVEFGDKVQLPPVTATVPKASDDMKEPPSESSGAGNYFFTPKEISCCILATENTRVFCSIMIALLVILSYVNLPRNIVKPKNIIASRPLYVLLLTDFSIVIGLLILEKRRGSEKAKEEEVKGSQEDEHNWGGAVTVLELGLVLHQALRAIFIDCSFYVVIVICGFSMM